MVKKERRHFGEKRKGSGGKNPGSGSMIGGRKQRGWKGDTKSGNVRGMRIVGEGDRRWK